ncbi:MAG TPA: AMP-binding protein [Thermoleophilaceae bacterium]|jgi:fatty-acyl-CoA synthase
MTGATEERTGAARSPAPPAGTIPEALERGVREGASLTLIDADLSERLVTGDELLDGAERAAAALRAHDLAPGDHVCLLSPTSLELVQVLMGCWRAGLVATMAALPRSAESDVWKQNLRSRVETAGIAAILAPEALSGFVRPLEVTGRTLDFESLVSYSERIAEPAGRGPDDVAYLQFTSGSTGASRAVALTHSHIVWNTYPVFQHSIGLGPEDVRVSWLPLYHDFGLLFLLAGVFTGAPFVIQPTEQYLRRPGSWLDACDRLYASATAGPNSAYGLAARELTLKPRELDLSRLRVVLNGSEPIDVATMEAFAAAAAPYGLSPTAQSAAYGLAEATLAVTWTPTDDAVTAVTVSREGLGEPGAKVRLVEPDEEGARRMIGCGLPIPETEIRIVGPGGEAMPPLHVGEIAVRGPSVMAGYVNDDEATAEALRDGWLHTGDLGFLAESGELVPCGRIKDMIIAGGRNLYPEEYEFVVERVDGVRKGNVVAVSLPELERMAIIAETKHPAEEAEALARRVFDAVGAELDPPPSEVVMVPPGTIPKTSSGKRRRGLCRDRYLAGALDVLGTARR